jgi:hypothetical protein
MISGFLIFLIYKINHFYPFSKKNYKIEATYKMELNLRRFSLLSTYMMAHAMVSFIIHLFVVLSATACNIVLGIEL